MPGWLPWGIRSVLAIHADTSVCVCTSSRSGAAALCQHQRLVSVVRLSEPSSLEGSTSSYLHVYINMFPTAGAPSCSFCEVTGAVCVNV